MKLFNSNPKQCYDIISYVKKHDVIFPMRKKYDLTHYQIKRICQMFNGLDIKEIQEKINDIIITNKKRGVLYKNGKQDAAINYRRYKDYYTKYNKDRSKKRRQIITE